MACTAMWNQMKFDTCRAAACPCAPSANRISLILDAILVSIFVILSIGLQVHAAMRTGKVQAVL